MRLCWEVAVLGASPARHWAAAGSWLDQLTASCRKGQEVLVVTMVISTRGQWVRKGQAWRLLGGCLEWSRKRGAEGPGAQRPHGPRSLAPEQGEAGGLWVPDPRSESP